MRKSYHYISGVIMMAVLFGCLIKAQVHAAEPDSLVTELSVTGNRHFSERAVLEIINFPVVGMHETVLRNALDTQLLSAYRTDGYLSAQVDTLHRIMRDNSARMSLVISEGTRTEIREVVLPGISEQRRDIVARMLDLSGHYSQGRIEAAIRRALNWYENQGYPFCEIRIGEESWDSYVESDGKFIDLTLHVRESGQVMVDSLVVTGNDFTSRRTVMRESGLREDIVFSQEAVDRAGRKLSRLSYLQTGAEPELVTLPDGRHGIVLDVVEQPAHQFSGILGYAPSRTDESSGYLTGHIDVRFGNLFGTGRMFSAEWRGKDETSQEMQIRYKEPWLLGSPLSMDFAYEQAIQDSSYLQRSISAGLHWPVGDWLETFLRVGRRTTSPDEYGETTYAIASSRSWFGELGVTWDSRDHPLNPRSGLFYQAGYTFARRRNTGETPGVVQPETSRDESMHMDFRMAAPLRGRSVGYVRIAAHRVRAGTGIIPFSHLMPLGGARTLRGYREDQFRGSTVSWFNAEFRYLTGERSRLFLFYDGGFIDRTSSTLWKSGYGWGLRIDSRVGVIGIDFGLGVGDSPTEGKLHFGLESAF
jgi:outer membrane protein assembly factor BamA